MAELPTQIQAAQRELELRKRVYPHHIERKKLSQEKAAAEIANMEAIVRTLEWLYANEAKIKAKLEPHPPTLPATESTRVYTQRQTAFLDYSKGGWEHHFEIFDDAGALIGFKHVGQETRTSETYVQFIPFGARTFDNPKAFIEAYERGEWKGRSPDVSQEAAA